MELLSQSSFYETMIRCHDNDNYKAIIVFNRLKDVSIFIKELDRIHREIGIPGVDKISSLAGVGSLGFRFKNGSQIELITISENTHGRKCNEIIYDSSIDINKDGIRHKLQCMLVPYKCGAYESTDSGLYERHMINSLYEESQHSEELDEFLGSFSITE